MAGNTNKKETNNRSSITRTLIHSIAESMHIQGREDQKKKPEFKIGDIITLDRYNHIDDVQKSKIIGYTTIGWHENERLAYEIDVNGVTIISTGISIMESELYEPAPEEDR